MSEILDIRNLRVDLKSGRNRLPVIEGLSLTVRSGEVLGIVGESGCGKSALSLTVMGLLPPALVRSQGEIHFNGRPIHRLGPRELRAVRGREMAMIFQDPLTSLNPGLTIGDQTSEMLRVHLGLSRKMAWEQAAELLHGVGLPQPSRLMKDYPHQLSGGMRQRVMIAMAVSCSPRLLIADEPTTALDVTIQAQILELLRRINRDNGTAVVLISHDIGVIAEICDRVAVMYAGKIVEEGTVGQLLEAPRHPYTQALLNAIPTPDKKHRSLFTIPGTVPALHERGRGCGFSSRCSYATPRCREEVPSLLDIGLQHRVSCFEAGKGAREIAGIVGCSEEVEADAAVG